MAREELKGTLLENYPEVFDLSTIVYKVKHTMEILTVRLGDLNQIRCLTNILMQRWQPLSGTIFDVDV